MFVVIYTWRVKPELVSEFRRIWRTRTEKITKLRGSYGSLLLQDSDGAYSAIALWPSREAWKADDPPLPADEQDAAIWAACIIESFTPRTMMSVDNLWRLP